MFAEGAPTHGVVTGTSAKHRTKPLPGPKLRRRLFMRLETDAALPWASEELYQTVTDGVQNLLLNSDVDMHAKIGEAKPSGTTLITSTP